MVHVKETDSILRPKDLGFSTGDRMKQNRERSIYADWELNGALQPGFED